MSATLRVEDFTMNKLLFPIPPPVVRVKDLYIREPPNNSHDEGSLEFRLGTFSLAVAETLAAFRGVFPFLKPIHATMSCKM